MPSLTIKCINVQVTPIEMLEIERWCYQAFDRFEHFIREAEIILRDANGPKGGVDKVCTLQLRFYPRGVAVAKASGTSVSQAVSIACNKMQQIAAKRLSRRRERPTRHSAIEMEYAQSSGTASSST